MQQSSSSINQRMEAEPALQGLAGNSEGMATTFSGDRSSGLAGAPAGDHVGGWGVRTSSMGGDPSSSENAARCGIPARANEQGTPSSIAHNTAVDANLPARLLAATSEDVMVVESGDDESDVENFEAYPTDTEATGSVEIEGSKENENENENELMEQLLGLWRKLRIENAELRAQVRRPPNRTPAAPYPRTRRPHCGAFLLRYVGAPTLTHPPPSPNHRCMRRRWRSKKPTRSSVWPSLLQLPNLLEALFLVAVFAYQEAGHLPRMGAAPQPVESPNVGVMLWAARSYGHASMSLILSRW